MTRLKANREILRILTDIVNICPQWRFFQLLRNVGAFSSDDDIGRTYDFYTESAEILKRLKKKNRIVGK